MSIEKLQSAVELQDAGSSSLHVHAKGEYSLSSPERQHKAGKPDKAALPFLSCPKDLGHGRARLHPSRVTPLSPRVESFVYFKEVLVV